MFNVLAQFAQKTKSPISRTAEAEKLLPTAEKTLIDLAAAPMPADLKDYLARELRCTIAVCKEAHLPTQDDRAAAREMRNMAVAVAQMNTEIAKAEASYAKGYAAGKSARPFARAVAAQ